MSFGEMVRFAKSYACLREDIPESLIDSHSFIE